MGRTDIKQQPQCFYIMILPEEIVEWVAAGVNLCDHFIEVSAEFVDTHLFSCGNEDARRIFLSYPAVHELLKSVVLLSLGSRENSSYSSYL